MIMLFEQEEATKRYGRRMRAEGRDEGCAEGRVEGRAEGRVEGRAEGRVEGRAEGRTEGQSEGKLMMCAEMIAQGALSIEKAAGMLGMSVNAFKQALEAIKTTV